MKKIMAVLVSIFICLSCSDDTGLPAKLDPDESQYVSVKLTVTLPASVAYIRTRGMIRAIDHESSISEIQVLVFEEGKYKYRVPGLVINNSASAMTFEVLLKSSNSTMRLFVLANCSNAVIANEPAIDDSEDVVKKKINCRFDNLTSDFPMYGECELPAGLSTTEINHISGIKMLRSIARVDVKASEVTNFKLTGVKAYRANNYLQIIPNETGAIKVTVPSVPDGSNRNVDSAMFPVAPENQNEFSAQLYLPETDSPESADWVSGATCIVVEGYYADSDTPSYYRLDFDANNEHKAFGQVLRNHKYIFNIKKVSAPGWNNPDDAANNRSSSIVAEVQAWDDYTMDMYFDGEHHFGVSTREVVLKHKAGSGGIINVNTDLADYALQWADDAGTPQGVESQSLANDYFTVEKEQNGNQLVVTALQNNLVDGSRRTQNFVIMAGRWHILVNIQQIYNAAAYQTISLMSFTAGLGYLGTNIIGSSSAEGRGTGLRGILSNLANFGPNGTVVCGGYNLIGVAPANNNLTDALFASFDVVYVHYMSNSLFGNLDAQKANNWLKARNNRVLIVSYDASDVSQNLVKEILGGNTGVTYMTSNTGPFPLAASEAGNRYFTTDGPFTSGVYTPIPSGFSFRNYDIYHGEIQKNSAASVGITPILLGPGGGIVLGIDYSRRIVYWGDTDLSNQSGGTGGNNENHIINTTGAIDNNASKLIANVFAWIAETVLYGE